MRIWSLHPKYLDRQGLLACWRETLLAQKVLQGETRGYRHHPQLVRFRLHPDPLAAIASYLVSLANEAEARAYVFDRSLIAAFNTSVQLTVTRGQLLYEWEHLKAKLLRRDPLRYEQALGIALPDIHPLFILVEGGIEEWERSPSFK